MTEVTDDNSFTWWNSAEEAAVHWKYITYGILALCVSFFLYFSYYAGPNGDDLYQNYYADHVLDFYSSLGNDTTVLHHPQGHLKYYGGFYEIPSALINKALGYTVYDGGYHITRHLLNSVFGLLAICAMVFLGRQILNWRAAAIIALLFLSCPVFMFHGAINPKDIPFASGIALSLWAMWNWFKAWPQPSWKMTIILGLAMGSALAIRIGGLLLFGYLFLFGLLMMIHYRKKYSLAQILPRLLLHGFVAVFISYVICVAFWPYALLNPVKHVIESFLMFNEFDTNIRVLYGGENILSGEISGAYTVVWLVKTVSLICLLGFVLFIAFANKVIEEIGVFTFIILAFTFLFPLLYISIGGSNVYDAWRHSLFIYPPLACLAGVGIDVVWRNYFTKGSLYYYVAILIIVMLTVYPVFHMVRYPHYAYVYFNLLNNNPEKIVGQYETDYWALSVEKAIAWMEDEGLFAEASQEKPVTIITQTLHGLKVAVGRRGLDKKGVIIKYSRYPMRFETTWDYAVFPARFVPGMELRSGIYPGSYAIKTFYANGAPVCTILKMDTQDEFQKAREAMAVDSLSLAATYYEDILRQHPDNIPVLNLLSSIYLQQENIAELNSTIRHYKNKSPEDMEPYVLEGLIYLQRGDYPNAEVMFRTIRDIDPENYKAVFYLALIDLQAGNGKKAMDKLQETIELEPRFAEAYFILAEILESKGEKVLARKYKLRGEKLR